MIITVYFGEVGVEMLDKCFEVWMVGGCSQ